MVTAPGAITFILGRRDQPTDGVWDYTDRLAPACGRLGVPTGVRHVAWDREGWVRALLGLLRELKRTRPAWIVLQVTHLAWSKRGFSLGMLAPALVARVAGIRVAAVLHDPSGFGGARVRDRMRRLVQLASMRCVARICTKTFVTVHPSVIPWASRRKDQPELLVVGSNVWERDWSRDPMRPAGQDEFRVAVFGCTEGSRGDLERQTIVRASSLAARQLGRVHVLAFGRGTRPGEAWPQSDGVTVESMGLVSAEEASAILSGVDAMLFVRGGMCSRRGAAVAAIAHGLPVVGFRGSETAWPVTEAGVVLVDPGDVEGLAAGLVRVATDGGFAACLRRRNAEVYRRCFSWDAVASHLLAGLGLARDGR